MLVAWPTAADTLSGGGGGTVVSGLVAGVLAGGLCPRCLSTFFRLGFPATGATIAATGFCAAVRALPSSFSLCERGTTHVPPFSRVKSLSIHKLVIRGEASMGLPLNTRLGPSECQPGTNAPG